MKDNKHIDWHRRFACYCLIKQQISTENYIIGIFITDTFVRCNILVQQQILMEALYTVHIPAVGQIGYKENRNI